MTGTFRRWSTPYGPLRRDIGADRRLMNRQDLQNVFTRRWLWEISNPSARDEYNLELLHNHVHVWVGEQMSRIESSSYDPAFFSHHAFIDCLWEEFRGRQRSQGINPARDYPRIVGDQGHQPLVSMGLGRLLVIDGINDFFTRQIFRCAPRPSCVRGSNTCGSPYLRCNWSTETCLPLIMSNRARTQQTRRVQQTQRQPWWTRFVNNRQNFIGWAVPWWNWNNILCANAGDWGFIIMCVQHEVESNQNMAELSVCFLHLFSCWKPAWMSTNTNAEQTERFLYTFHRFKNEIRISTEANLNINGCIFRQLYYSLNIHVRGNALWNINHILIIRKQNECIIGNRKYVWIFF